MKIICSKSNLVKGVNIVSKAVPSKTTMPILQCILIDATTDIIKFTANDMELVIETVVDGSIARKGVVAIDLAGDEAKFKTSNFDKLFDEIKKKNIPFTIHAGEADSYESVQTAISFGTKRIGHGVRCIENNDTVKELVARGISLEICPTSNVNTKVVTDLKYHPIKKLVDAGVLVTINTDNRTVSNTNLDKEYDLLRKEFNFNDDDFLQFNLNAIDCAFLSGEEKENLRNLLLDNWS